VFSVVALACGCATIVKGTKQDIKLNSDPPGATAVIDRDIAVKTPATVKLSRKEVHTVVFTLEGYESKTVYLNQAMEPWVWGNVVLGGIIGLLVDVSSGAANRLTPQEINVPLNALPPSVSKESASGNESK
jgi:hypothetical protein